jgi:uncharacterized protein YbcI
MTEPGLQIAEIERALAAELLRIHEQAYGRGAGSSRVHYLQDTIICLMDDLEMLPNEVFLIEEGHGDGVVEVRGRYQQAIEATYRAAVERATGRRVTSFTSATKLDPNWLIEVFRLAPTTHDVVAD